MSRAQIVAVMLTVLLSALDGYDVLSMSFVAPAVGHAWHIGKATLGLVLSSGLVGMAAGSLGLAPVADVVGRKPLVLLAVALMIAGSLLSAVSHSVAELTGSRLVTGLGIGAIVAVITSIAAEFANARRRSLAVSAMAIGYPIGGVLGGIAAAALLKLHGWPSVFETGGVFGLLLLPSIAILLPESPAFLMSRRPRLAIERLNRVLARFGHPAVSALPEQIIEPRRSYRALFAPGMATTTLRLTLVNLLITTTAYYVLSWLPQMVADAGYRPSTASLVSATASLVGVAAGLAVGAVATFISPARLAATGMVGLGVAVAAFGFSSPALPMLLLAAGACGFFLFGSTGVFYATMAMSFTPSTRTSGAGFVMGVGRISSAVGPYLAGWLFAAGLVRGQVSLIFAVLAVAAGLILAVSTRARAAEA